MKKHKAKNITIWLVLLSLIGLAMNEIRTFVEQEIANSKEQDACWFLTERIEGVLLSDLSMWADRLDHNSDARMIDWFDLRKDELLVMFESQGLTEQEVTMCLDSLAANLAKGE